MVKNTTEYNREWYKKNKERRRSYFKEMQTCSCGSTVSRGSMYLHLRSKRHEKLAGLISKNSDNEQVE